MTKLVFIPLLALVACQAPSGTNEANEAAAANQVDAPVREVETVPPSETVVADGATAEAPVPSAIPAGFHGRWGLVPADCTSTRGDAKGLLTVTADRLTFYESRAVLGEVDTATASRFVGDFAFTGEGQNWARTVTLELDDGALLRSDEELTTPLRYRRCP